MAPGKVDVVVVNGEYFVEEIVAKRVVNGKIKYLVKWRGFPSSKNTWEPPEHLEGSEQFVELFEKSEKTKKGGTFFRRKRTIEEKQPKGFKKIIPATNVDEDSQGPKNVEFNFLDGIPVINGIPPGTVIKIIGATPFKNDMLYLVQWQGEGEQCRNTMGDVEVNVENTAFIKRVDANLKYPDIVIRFLQSHAVFRSTECIKPNGVVVQENQNKDTSKTGDFFVVEEQKSLVNSKGVAPSYVDEVGKSEVNISDNDDKNDVPEGNNDDDSPSCEGGEERKSVYGGLENAAIKTCIEDETGTTEGPTGNTEGSMEESQKPLDEFMEVTEEVSSCMAMDTTLDNSTESDDIDIHSLETQQITGGRESEPEHFDLEYLLGRGTDFGGPQTITFYAEADGNAIADGQNVNNVGNVSGVGADLTKFIEDDRYFGDIDDLDEIFGLGV